MKARISKKGQEWLEAKSTGKYRPLTKGEITTEALKYFQGMGFDCWRNNNIPVKRRQFIGRLGVPDIIGYSSETCKYDSGIFFSCEVKTENDKLSEEQKKFLVSLNKAGGFGYVAEDDKQGGVKYYLYLN